MHQNIDVRVGGVIELGVGLNLGLESLPLKTSEVVLLELLSFGELFNYSLTSFLAIQYILVKQHYGFRVKLLAIINYQTIHIQHVIGDSSKD